MRWGSSIFIALVIVQAFHLSCKSHRGKSFLPNMVGYPQNNMKEYILKKDLLEISGISYIENDRLAAINDEKGELFMVDLESNSLEKYKFGGKGDYEDVAKTDSAFFILESNGDLHEFYPTSLRHETYPFTGKGKIEFESLVWYKSLNKLVLITKEQKKNRDRISAFSFDLRTKQFDEAPFFTIGYKDIYIKIQNYNVECKPSAAAINPINHKLYIIASIGKVLLECTPDGKLEKLYKLNPTHFPQPEGITFADNGDMYISNEGLNGKATILKFPYVATK